MAIAKQIVMTKWGRVGMVSILAMVVLAFFLYKSAFAASDLRFVGCAYALKVYALLTSGIGPVSAYPVGINDANGGQVVGGTASADCTVSSCNWVHITSYPDSPGVQNGGPLARWNVDVADSLHFVYFTEAWCTSNTPPHDVLEPIKDENEDGHLLDDLEKHLKKRGSDPLPEDVKKRLKDKGW
jgi:hypothetical protein